MRNGVVRLTGAVVFGGLALAVASCSGGSNPPPFVQPGSTTSPPVTLSASPASIAFELDQNAPQTITVTRSAGSFASFTTAIAKPTLIGVTSTFASGTATVTVIPIASDAGARTTITFTDDSGATASASVTTAKCGRASDLYPSQLLYPQPGTTGVPTNIGMLYFAVESPTGHPTPKLHLIIGSGATLEGGTLETATAPPGAASPSPAPGDIQTIERGTVPALPAGTTIQAQLYDDTCQPVVLTGAFST